MAYYRLNIYIFFFFGFLQTIWEPVQNLIKTKTGQKSLIFKTKNRNPLFFMSRTESDTLRTIRFLASALNHKKYF